MSAFMKSLQNTPVRSYGIQRAGNVRAMLYFVFLPADAFKALGVDSGTEALPADGSVIDSAIGRWYAISTEAYRFRKLA